MIIVDADKLEDVLSESLGKNAASELIVALEEAGALRIAHDTAVVSADQAMQWAASSGVDARPLTPGDIEWLKQAISRSSVAEDIGTIAHSLSLPDAMTRDAHGRERRDITDRRYDYIVKCTYFPAMLSELFAVASEQEFTVLSGLAVRAGLIWYCPVDGHPNPHWFDSCAEAH